MDPLDVKPGSVPEQVKAMVSSFDLNEVPQMDCVIQTNSTVIDLPPSAENDKFFNELMESMSSVMPDMVQW